MDRIVVSVAELLSLAKELDSDGMDYVELTILEPQKDGDEVIPASLWPSAFKSSSPEITTDYDDIEHVPDFD